MTINIYINPADTGYGLSSCKAVDLDHFFSLENYLISTKHAGTLMKAVFMRDLNM